MTKLLGDIACHQLVPRLVIQRSSNGHEPAIEDHLPKQICEVVSLGLAVAFKFITASPAWR
ncbi:hypothetical protein SAMN05216374_2788 [Tardiphaga sp. OK246]|uniref:hypothetical protein n=1 Tax=Tardiphaga sp. OK246 TaxID=1855307 RepID=UPI000B67F0DD|nr:hypothetical protein [Tardiphaga sp. OK246]SNT12247.1 hypothetical protein SAMN05216374_2788 [Tardiphaga sp. OK246]